MARQRARNLVRVQWGINYKTFTIRYRRASGAVTEYAKRLAAIRGNDGALYPYLTIQAYADKREQGHLLSYAIVKTVRPIRVHRRTLARQWHVHLRYPLAQVPRR